jgi:beta-exotoxin I transport system permease protein
MTTHLVPRSPWRPVLLPFALRLGARTVAGWSIGVAAMAVLYVSLWPSLSGTTDYAKLLDSLPEAYQSLVRAAGTADMSTAAGYLNAELFAATGPLLIVVLAVMLGSGAAAGHERQGTLAMHLAEPIPRWRWLGEQALAVWLQIAVVGAVLAGALLVMREVVGLDVGIGGLVGACLHLTALGVMYAGVALALGAATGRPSVARAGTGLLALLGYLVQVFAPMVSWIDRLRPLSPFAWYGRDTPLLTGAHAVPLGVLGLTAVAAVVAGGLVFTRRDLRS